LKVLGAGRDEHALAAEDRGNEVRERLARAGTGFGEQHALVGEGARDGERHVDLARARLEIGHRLGERAVRRGRRGDGERKVARRARPAARYSGYRGNFRHSVWTSARTMPSAPSSSGVLSARAIRSPIMSISFSPIPRVVTAGVPMRTPLATIGGF